VEVRDRQQFGFPFGQPLGARQGLAFWAMPVAAGNGAHSITCIMESNFEMGSVTRQPTMWRPFAHGLGHGNSP
jgi:hypothetical protein